MGTTGRHSQDQRESHTSRRFSKQNHMGQPGDCTSQQADGATRNDLFKGFEVYVNWSSAKVPTTWKSRYWWAPLSSPFLLRTSTGVMPH